MKEGKTRTTVDVDLKLWSLVVQQATAKGKKVSEIVEDIFREYFKEQLKE